MWLRPTHAQLGAPRESPKWSDLKDQRWGLSTIKQLKDSERSKQTNLNKYSIQMYPTIQNLMEIS